MYNEFEDGDGHLRKSVSFDSSPLPSLCANTFCEELADALLQRASSLRTFHPSVIVGREERFIESLIDLARAIRPTVPKPEEAPQQDTPEQCVEINPSQEIAPQVSPLRIPKCRRFQGVARRMERKKGKRKTLWSRVRRRLIKEHSGLQKLEWRRVKKTLRKRWKTKKTIFVRWVDNLLGNFNQK